MAPANIHHALAVEHASAGRLQEALASLRRALQEFESCELWNDWAAVQHALGRSNEAEAGFRLALAVEPQNAEAGANLRALLASHRFAGHFNEAGCKSAEQELRRFLSDDPNEQAYFHTHLARYITTLCCVPNALSGQAVLELGAAFHHITPALGRLKHYGEVRCHDIWDGPKQIVRELHSEDGADAVRVVVDNFDLQVAPWPYADESFDAILFCEILEHLHSDPMRVLAEIHRVLRPGGALVLTTPNLASAHSVACSLRGESPYVYGKFERDGFATDRHNREYTAREVERLGKAAGIDARELFTCDSWWQPDREILRMLAAHGQSIALRGDNTFFVGRKTTPVRNRYPEEFYSQSGTQANRRNSQNSATASHAAGPTAPALPRHLLVIHELLPHFDQSGSDLRLLDVLRELRAQGHQVTLIARDGKDAERYSPPLEDLGIRVLAGDPDRMRHLGGDGGTSWSFANLLAAESFDAAILCQWFWSGISIPEHYLDEIRRCSPATRIAVLTDDRHGERERRAARLSGQFADAERAEDFEDREIAAYRAADMVLYITEADRAHFSGFHLDAPMEHLPIVVTPESSAQREFSERSGVLFLGNFENLANREALHWFLAEIWAHVLAANPAMKLFVAGHACPADLPENHPGVVTLGKVASLADTFCDRVALVAPIRVGTGINTKNLQALAHGLPVITTSVGAEGLRLVNRENALIADSAKEFSDCILGLSVDAVLWKQLSENGRALAARNFSQAALSARFHAILDSLSGVTPKRNASRELDSYREVERLHPETLTSRPPCYRLALRTLGYWQLGAQALAAGDHARALRQFRHVFTAVRGALPDNAFYRRLLSDMAEAYRSLGAASSSTRCRKELGRLVPFTGNKQSQQRNLPGPACSTNKHPVISVVLPTFNRISTLKICLAALAFQTLPVSEWEVIVVDDGSTDGTSAYFSETPSPFFLQTISQSNQGAGAARRAGVMAARGEYVVLCNDDTVASSNLLAEHCRLQRKYANTKSAVLGQFFPSSECAHRALSFWINHSPFLFPQQSLKAGQLCDSAHFVTCNLSIRRQAITGTGNFDPIFRVAEDSELGARLTQSGYQVRFEPSAAATHEHPSFTSADLLRRASIYGSATLQLVRKHPHLLGDGAGPFGLLQDSDFRRIERAQREKREAAQTGLAALRSLDDFDLLPLWNRDDQGNRPVDAIIEKVGAIVPTVYWFFFFQSFLAAASSQSQHSEPALHSSVVAT
jgi:GT2 family glycosyltransferase/SAM-dependent methyltransferase/glycosyltransferase involved in cell wall biosynthesis